MKKCPVCEKRPVKKFKLRPGYAKICKAPACRREYLRLCYYKNRNADRLAVLITCQYCKKKYEVFKDLKVTWRKTCGALECLRAYQKNLIYSARKAV